MKKIEETPLVVPNELAAIDALTTRFGTLLKKSNFKKMQQLAGALGIKLSHRGKHSIQIEELGTTTGSHIAGTGDDSSTVVVKKKKKDTIYGILRRARQK